MTAHMPTCLRVRADRVLHGQASVEFILILPFLMLLCLGAYDVSNLVVSEGNARAVAADAARWASQKASGKDPQPGSEVEKYARSTGLMSAQDEFLLTETKLADEPVTMRTLANDGSADKEVGVKVKRNSYKVTVTAKVKVMFPVALVLPTTDGYVSITRSSTAYAAVDTTL